MWRENHFSVTEEDTIDDNNIKNIEYHRIKDTNKAVAIIDERTVVRESMIKMLKQLSTDLTFFPFSTVPEVLEQGDNGHTKYNLCLLNIGSTQLSEAMLESTIKSLRATFLDISIIVLADNDDLLSLRLFLKLGLDGFMTTNISLDELVAGLKLVLVGGRYIPEGLILMMQSNMSGSYEYKKQLKNTPNIDNINFTPRQLEVLEMLYHGESNKMIAFQLKICESTVKVHVREIMKKLCATNRTQVAYLVYGFFEKNNNE